MLLFFLPHSVMPCVAQAVQHALGPFLQTGVFTCSKKSSLKEGGSNVVERAEMQLIIEKGIPAHRQALLYVLSDRTCSVLSKVLN